MVVEKASFERLTKENMELRMAIKTVVAGELALRQGRTRSFREFLKSKFSHYIINVSGEYVDNHS